jgi:hypothetical protein
MLLSFAQWVQFTAFFSALRPSWYAYPIVMSTHLLGIALFGGLILMTDLRLLGLVMTKYSVTDVVDQLRWPKRIGFIIVATCGLLMLGCKAEEYYYNAFVRIKLPLIALVFVHGWVFRKSVYYNTEEIDRSPQIPGRVKLAATLSLILWASIACAGRGIGYIDPPLSKIHAEVPAAPSRTRYAVTHLVRPRQVVSMPLRAAILLCAVTLICGLLFPAGASAHNVSKRDASFVQSNDGAAIAPFLYLGAKHMVTGYDHLAFLVGVVFFLYRLKDVVLYVSLFTLGHSVTLLAGVLGGIHANSYFIDAIIGFSVVYKAFDNMGGFRRFLGFEPNTKVAVLIFGLFHGFGLATKLQELDLSKKGLVTNIVSFNVGVEIGQVLALTAVLIALSFWRTRRGFLRHAFATNTALMSVGFVLTGYQIAGYYLGS